jgi:hypothetical protein
VRALTPVISHSRRALVALAVLTPFALAACGDGAPGTVEVAKGTLVGKISGSNAYFALISDGKSVGGYVSDGRKVSRWLARRPIRDGHAELWTRAGRRLGAAELTKVSASGDIRIGPKPLSFFLEVTPAPAGVYRATTGRLGRPSSAEIGWVVLGDGTQRGTAELIDRRGKLSVVRTPRLDVRTRSAPLRTGGKIRATPLSMSFLKRAGDR